MTFGFVTANRTMLSESKDKLYQLNSKMRSDCVKKFYLSLLFAIYILPETVEYLENEAFKKKVSNKNF